MEKEKLINYLKNQIVELECQIKDFEALILEWKAIESALLDTSSTGVVDLTCINQAVLQLLKDSLADSLQARHELESPLWVTEP